MKLTTVGYTGKKQNIKCDVCNRIREQELVITQKQLRIGRLVIMGLGNRDFYWTCDQDHMNGIAEKSQLSLNKLRYYAEKQNDDEQVVVRESKRISYPIMSEERRKAIVQDNRKEGLLSSLFGIIISIVVMPFSRTIGLAIAVLSVLGGLYLAFEEPAKKHEAIIQKHGHQKEL